MRTSRSWSRRAAELASCERSRQAEVTPSPVRPSRSGSLTPWLNRGWFRRPRQPSQMLDLRPLFASLEAPPPPTSGQPIFTAVEIPGIAGIRVARDTCHRALLLREILGPPRSLQTDEDMQARPSEGRPPENSRMAPTGRRQNGVSTSAHRNGHGHAPPGIAADRASRVALPPASPESVVSEPPQTRIPSSLGVTSNVIAGSAGAIRGFLRRIGIRL